MRALLGTLLIFSAIAAVLLALGAGIGLLLHWIIPSVDLGIGILIGVLTIGFTAQLFARISSLPSVRASDPMTMRSANPSSTPFSQLGTPQVTLIAGSFVQARSRTWICGRPTVTS